MKDSAPVATTNDGAVRGTTVGTVNEFLGIPYAAPPVSSLRWRPPAAAASWHGVRDATQFGPSCPQATEKNPFLPPGPISEDCLYLNVYTTASHPSGHRPVLVWIHGGGLVQDGARNYDGSKLAADGAVVVTINYRLGALGFLAHPALASRPGGSAGNYGLMDQQAALRWVQRNIAQFGGDPRNVTIAGQSAGGLSVLAQMVSSGARGLFQRAIVQSGTFALTQRPLATAQAAGEKFAKSVGCTDQTAQCLRAAPVSDLVSNFGVEIPGVVDGSVLTQSIGTALAHGQSARVPVINGITSLLVSDASFACPALQVDRWTAARGLPTYAYQFNDDNAPLNIVGSGLGLSTHGTELPYLFDQPNAPFPAMLNAGQQALAASMRAAWTSFAASGNPSTHALPWPSIGNGTKVLSFVPSQSQVTTDFAAAHHCSPGCRSSTALPTTRNCSSSTASA